MVKIHSHQEKLPFPCYPRVTLLINYIHLKHSLSKINTISYQKHVFYITGFTIINPICS